MTHVLQLLPLDLDFESRHQAAALGEPIVEFHTLAEARRAARARQDISVIHAWGIRALVAATLLPPARIIYSCGPEPRWNTWHRFFLRRPNVQVVCPTSTLRDLHIRRGVSLERAHIIRPPVAPITNSLTRDALSLRPDDIVLLAAGESTWAADHTAAVWCVSILERLNPRYRLLLWGRGPLAERAAGFGDQFGQRGMVILAEQRLRRSIDFASLIPLGDLMLHTARAPAATMPVLQAQAAGLPIVSTITPTAAELLKDGVNAFLADPPTPRILAQRVMDLGSAPLVNRIEIAPVEQFVQSYRVLFD